MQIRLTVIDPMGPSAQPGRTPSRDVLVTAPAGTALAAVASGLASAVLGETGAGRESGGAPVVLYAGAERLDAGRCTLGEPPLVDGAMLHLGTPAEPEAHPEPDDAPARLHVVAGPDAGGVHLLHGGRITIGRSASADVPLDDPDVSRVHCSVTVAADGRVTVTDLGSTNGTSLDGTRVGERPVRFASGALLRIGESALRLAPPGGPGARLATEPDGEGCVRVVPGTAGTAAAGCGTGGGTAGPAGGVDGGAGGVTTGPVSGFAPGVAGGPVPGARGVPGASAPAHAPTTHGTGTHSAQGAHASAHDAGARPYPDPTHHAYGSAGWDTPGTAPDAQDHSPAPRPAARPGSPASSAPHASPASPASPSAPGAPAGPPLVPEQGGAPGIESRGPAPSARGAVPDGRYAPDGHAPGGRAHDGPPWPPPSDAAHGTAPDGDPAGTGATRARDGGDAKDRDGRAGAADGTRKGTPLRGTDVPQGLRRRGGLTAWARRLTGGRGDSGASGEVYVREGSGADLASVPGGTAPDETWPDPAALLLTALGPGPRLWERGPGHPETLTVRLGTADRKTPDGAGVLAAVPVTADLRETGALGLAGPRARLNGLARAVLAQLAALHAPGTLEIVLISADRSRSAPERTADWSWLGWLPHVRPAHGQDCRLLLAYDREQAAARTQELLRRLEDHTGPARPRPHPGAGLPAGHTGTPAGPAGTPPGRPGAAEVSYAAGVPRPRTAVPARPSWAGDEGGADGPAAFAGPYTVVVLDGDPGGADLGGALTRLALEGPRAGIHVLCLAETEPSPEPSAPAAQQAPEAVASSAARTYEAACAVAPVFRACGAVAFLGGDVATALRLLRVAHPGTPSAAASGRPDGFTGPDGRAAPGPDARAGAGEDGRTVTGPVAPGVLAAVDAVSTAWAERFARALAPLRTEGTGGERQARVAAPLPRSARLLDELGLARATPASLMARWADAADDTDSLGGRAWAVLGAGPHGPLLADLVAEGPHLLVEGPPGSGRTELLRAVVAGLSSAERPDRLGIVLIDGRDGTGASAGHGEGLRACTDIPHVTTHLIANDPVRMREFAQALSAELKRRSELLGRTGFAEWHAGREVSGRLVPQRTASGRGAGPSGDGDLEAPPSSTLRLRPGAAARQRTEAAPPLPRLVVVVDDLDALVSPALGSPGRPSAGSVLRALEAVAREGDRLGVHLVAATGPGGRTAQTEPSRLATLRVALDAPSAGPDEPAPGRGRLTRADGRATAFQAGRVTGRIPRTATLRPTVVPLDWSRMGDPPARRPVRELGNGPTDLALLASAVERAAREVAAVRIPSLL